MATAAIRTLGLTKHFGRLVTLKDLDLDLDVSPGEIFGFLGPNGAGKSTTIRLLLGLIRPTAGEAWLEGVLPGCSTCRRSRTSPEFRRCRGPLRPGSL
jgi:ABC-2 type transport system ATP-binding protein